MADPIIASTTAPEIVENSTLKWRAIFAGAFVAFLTYMVLMSLGLAFGGANLEGAISGNDSMKGLGVGTAIWLALSVLISLFAGGYAAARSSALITNRVGRIQGLVVASVFFGLLLSQVGAAIGTLSAGLGSAVGMIGGGVGDLSKNPQIQAVVDDAIGDLNLKSSPETVASGVASRLLRGNDQSALNYLANQAGISQAEAQARVSRLKQDVSQAANDVGIAAGKGMKVAGWTLFVSFVLGSLSAMFGGSLGAQLNLRSPLSRMDRQALRHHHAAT